MSADRWQAWDAFLESVPETGFMQTSWWADFRATTGYENFGVTLKHQRAIVGGAVVLKLAYAPQACFYYIPDGPVLPADAAVAAEVFEAILAGIDEHRRAEQQTVSHLRIEPRWERLPSFVRDFRPVAPFADGYMEPRTTLCVDLRPPEAAILAQMKPKGRYNIRVAQRHGVTVVEDTSREGVADFLRIYKEMTARQGIGGKQPDYFGRLVAILKSRNRGEVLFAEYQGTRLGAVVAVYFGARATYFFGGSADDHRNVMAPYLLHFEIMRRAKARGHLWYDLWGVAPANEPNHRWSGISEFKRKFGGVEVNLVPTLDCVYDPAAYERYIAIEGND